MLNTAAWTFVSINSPSVSWLMLAFLFVIVIDFWVVQAQIIKANTDPVSVYCRNRTREQDCAVRTVKRHTSARTHTNTVRRLWSEQMIKVIGCTTKQQQQSGERQTDTPQHRKSEKGRHRETNSHALWTLTGCGNSCCFNVTWYLITARRMMFNNNKKCFNSHTGPSELISKYNWNPISGCSSHSLYKWQKACNYQFYYFFQLIISPIKCLKNSQMLITICQSP